MLLIVSSHYFVIGMIWVVSIIRICIPPLDLHCLVEASYLLHINSVVVTINGFRYVIAPLMFVY